MKPARNLIGIVVRGVFKLTASVQLGHDNLGGGHAFFLVHAHRNAAAIVLYADAAIGVELDQNQIAMTGQSLVDRIV